MGIENIRRPGSFYSYNEKPKRTAAWNPTETLEIVNPDRGCLTCVGYAPSCRRRCRNPINAANRASAFAILEKLSFIEPRSADIRPQLKKLAGLTLCLRYHQDQVNSVVSGWEDEIEETFPKPTVKRGGARSPVFGRMGAGKLSDGYDSTSSRNGGNGFGESFTEKAVRYDRVQHIQEQMRRLQEELEAEQRRQQGERQREEEDRKKQEEEDRKKQEEEDRKKQEEEDRKKQEEEDKRERERERKAKEEREREKRRRESEERERQQEEERKQREQEARERQKREDAAKEEKARQQRQQAAKEKRAREAKDKAEKDRREWDLIWQNYEDKWNDLQRGDKTRNLLSTIPWPVRSGKSTDLDEAAIKNFFRMAIPTTASANSKYKIMSNECLKWHVDKIQKLTGGCEPDKSLIDLFNMVIRVVYQLRTEFQQQRNQ